MWDRKASDQVSIEIKMVDSERHVKPRLVVLPVVDSESLKPDAGNIPNMPSNRDTILSDYLRYRIAEWLKANPNREQRELAALGGFPSDSGIAMVKRGAGVGRKTAPRFAQAFGFASVDAMVDAAYEWRKGLGGALDRRLADHAFVTAANTLASFMVAPTEVELRTIASSFVDARFDNREPDWWIRTLGDELKRDRAREQASKVEKSNAKLEKGRRLRREEGEWRAAAARKHDVQEAAAELQRREQAVEADVDRLKRRRKIRVAG